MKEKLKKLCLILAALVVIVNGFTACGGKTDDAENNCNDEINKSIV